MSCNINTDTDSIDKNTYLAETLCRLFAKCFSVNYDTVLVSGASEPLYEPAKANQPARIYFAHDYFSSALHEVAHWCIAGEERRNSVDYDYWYIADGRDDSQQAEFYRVEVKPQALEWAFSLACNYTFRVSIDNLKSVPEAMDWRYWQKQKELELDFVARCQEQLEQWFSDGFPPRAWQYICELQAYYRHSKQITFDEFRNYH